MVVLHNTLARKHGDGLRSPTNALLFSRLRGTIRALASFFLVAFEHEKNEVRKRLAFT